MKIWLDLRFVRDNLYSTFVLELTKWLIEKASENSFVIYSNSELEWFKYPNVEIKNVWIKNASFKEQTSYLKILKNEKNDLMLFFDHYKPVFYVWNYVTILHSLKDIYYSDFSNYFEKYSFLYLLEKNLKKSSKIICFDANTVNELVEKFNIEERKTHHLSWFFPNADRFQNIEDLKIDIKIKYSLKNDYFIYSWWEWVEKNYEKLVHAFKKFKDAWTQIDLVFLWETISRNVNLRNLVINLEMQDRIHFIWVIKQAEKSIFYKNSVWVVFPSFYEPFPFRLTEPLYFNKPIIASDLKNIKDIFWDKINYLSAISVNNIYDNIKQFIEEGTKDKPLDYDDIKQKYTKENTINDLVEIIK